jgi:ribonuclease Z
VRPTLHPRLVNGRSGDPAVFVEALHRPSALLFDLGDLSPLATRDLLRIEHVFVSHMHMDHFIGFDRLLRMHVGRHKRIVMIGPAGFADSVGHKLHAYSWDLVDRYTTDLVLDVVEVVTSDMLNAARFRFKTGFTPEPMDVPSFSPGPVLCCPDFTLRMAVLEHHGDSLAFAVEEPMHINVWRNRLDARGLSPGPWLQPLKRAIAANAADDTPIALPTGEPQPLETLRDLVSLEAGQKIAYVTDVADTPANRRSIEALAHRADTLFIEASFAAADHERAAGRAHLTTQAAGEIARTAHVRRVEPFHFSPRYDGLEEQMMAEVQAAFEANDEQGSDGRRHFRGGSPNLPNGCER